MNARPMSTSGPAARPPRGRGALLAALLAAAAVLPACGAADSDEPTPIPLDGGVEVDAAPEADEGPIVPAAACANGRDDDGDGFVDHPNDPGCASATDDDEIDDDPEGPPACANGIDDDGDGTTDFPADRGCGSAADPEEGDDPPVPACGNGVDDDADGYTDFPGDPGCGSALDGDETDSGQVLPQCADGNDNDRDGLIDLADPGCTGVADPREETPEEQETPACADGLDNDADGVIDFPNEPGCSAAGDPDEENPGVPPDCADGRDNDEDGAVDYPDDPGCQGVGDRDEADPGTPPPCADGVDNDRDGATDYPDDRGCQSAADASEAGSCGVAYDPIDLAPDTTVHGDTRGGRFLAEGTCGGRGAAEVVYGYRIARALEALEIRTVAPEGMETFVETTIHVRRTCLDPDTEVACGREALDGIGANTLRIENPEAGEYTIFIDGATGNGGPFSLTVTEVPLAACLNRLDDDGDGRADYPTDPGCTSRDDRDETDPETPTACSNDEDDDADGLIDYPLDLGCEAAADQDEVDVCGQGVRVADFPVGEPFMLGDTTDGTTQFQGSCVPGNGAESIVRFRNPFNARLLFSVDHPETVDNTGLYVRTDCVNARSEVANGCNTGVPGVSARGRVRIDRAPPGDYFVVVDHSFGQGGPFKLSVQVDRLPAGCADGADGDGDGFIDGDDRGCESALDEDERDPPPGADPICDNGLDDDGDGETDYPFDVGCAAKGGINEDDPPPDALPECANGLDDDADDRTDFPFDPGCQARGDDSERNPVPAARCSDGVDQDRDGFPDYPFDPGCDAAGDPSEEDPDIDPVCKNLLDDDRDGLVDFPFDPGCESAADRDETDEDPANPPACANRIDDDDDGIADYPMDPGCRFRADDDETDPNFAPACANGRDDDGDGRADFPDDVGCSAAFDTDEVNDGRALDRCRDGVDNDGDTLIDLADPGCLNGRDNDEGDIGPTACNNGADDDGDGLVDWPEDDGCAARGAQCEQAGYGLCDGVCVDLQNAADNCGRCGRVCEAGVECIRGACGGLLTFEGIRENLPEADLDGWTLCHQDTFGANTPIANFLAACDGEYVMYGCRQVGAANLSLAAMGERAAVFTDTGDRNNNVNTHNGVSFYFSQNTSIGFVPAGENPSRNSCDTGQGQGQLRMCWHTSGNALNPGYRCGNQILNGNAGWERLIYTSR
jgi:hypothetical protein